jgi:hypothetical protein
MKQDRIQIDGVWYVREQQTQVKTLEPKQITKTVNYIYETDKYSFEAAMIYRDDHETLYPDVSIEFTDKRHAEREFWITEYWDNPSWMRGVYHNDPDSMQDATTTMDQEGIEDFRAFLKYLETVDCINLDKQD